MNETHCPYCHRKIFIKSGTDNKGTPFTKRICRCGCLLIRVHIERKFIPASEFDPEYKIKTERCSK